MSAPRYRFAPSPTGFFHVGGARTALFNWALACQSGGTFVLRIEDTDASRNAPEWTQGIIDALAWLGIDGEDPHFAGPLYQSEYAAAHVAAAQQLYENGAAYYCEMTSEEIAERAGAEGGNGYLGWSRDLGLGPGPGRVLRFRVPDGVTVVHDEVRGDVEFDNSVIEDFVLLRSDGSPVFMLANVVDDHEMGITNVVRAEEHLPNTPKQQMIFDALGWQVPTWAHVPVLVNEQRKKLSKRRDKVALEQYRSDGYLAAAMVNYLMTLGWSPGETEIQPWESMQAAFRLSDVNLSPAFFDLKKLNAFNGDYIRHLSIAELVDACDPWLPADWDRHRFAQIAPAIQPRLVTLADAPRVVDFLFLEEPMIDADSWENTMSADYAAPLLDDVAVAYAELAEAGRWTADELKSSLETVMERFELKLGKAQAPVRVAVTGRTVGPPLFEAIEVLGQDDTLARIHAARERLR